MEEPPYPSNLTQDGGKLSWINPMNSGAGGWESSFRERQVTNPCYMALTHYVLVWNTWKSKISPDDGLVKRQEGFFSAITHLVKWFPNSRAWEFLATLQEAQMPWCITDTLQGGPGVWTFQGIRGFNCHHWLGKSMLHILHSVLLKNSFINVQMRFKKKTHMSKMCISVRSHTCINTEMHQQN